MDARTARRRAPGSGQAQIDSASRGQIGAQLRAAYDEFSGLPLPDDHIDLLLALRRKERELKRKASGT